MKKRKTISSHLWISLFFIILAGCHASKSTDNKTNEDASTASSSIAEKSPEQTLPEQAAQEASTPSEQSQTQSADSEKADTDTNAEKAHACRVLLTYETGAEDILSWDGKILEGQGNESWSELVTFDPSGMHVQKVDGSLAYIDQQFIQIYPVEFRYKTAEENNTDHFYNDADDLRWHAWYIRNLKSPAEQDAILFYYMPHTCYIQEFSARYKMYKIFDNPDYDEDHRLWRDACAEYEEKDEEDWTDLPKGYKTSTMFSIMNNYLNIRYVYREKDRYPDPENGDFLWNAASLSITTKLHIDTRPTIEYFIDHKWNYFYDHRNNHISNYISNHKYANLLSHKMSKFPLLNASKLNHPLDSQEPDEVLQTIRNENQFILNPIFYTEISEYTPKNFINLNEIDNQPLVDNYPPVLLHHDGVLYYLSYYSPQIQETLKPMLDNLMHAPDGCGEFDWRTMTFRGQGQTYKLEHPDVLAGIAWVTTDDAIPVENLVKLPIVKEID